MVLVIFSCRNTVIALKKSIICCKEGWKLIFAGSWFTKPAEHNYSPTEGEALALSYSLHHSHLFTLGCQDLFVAIDHKPFLEIFNNCNLGSIDNPKIQSLKKHFAVALWYYPLPWQMDLRTKCFAMLPGKISSSLTIICEQPGEFDSSTCSSVEHALEISSILGTNEMGCVYWPYQYCSSVQSSVSGPSQNYQI